MITARPLIIGTPTGPQAPYPLQMEGRVIRGFGRGSKELGIPTANLPVDNVLTPWISTIKSGAYFGWASLGYIRSNQRHYHTPPPPRRQPQPRRRSLSSAYIQWFCRSGTTHSTGTRVGRLRCTYFTSSEPTSTTWRCGS